MPLLSASLPLSRYSCRLNFLILFSLMVSGRRCGSNSSCDAGYRSLCATVLQCYVTRTLVSSATRRRPAAHNADRNRAHCRRCHHSHPILMHVFKTTSLSRLVCRLIISTLTLPMTFVVPYHFSITTFYAKAFPHLVTITTSEHDFYVQDTDYIPYLTVSILVIALVVGGLIQSGTAAAREWENATMKELLLSPASRSAMVIGKMLAAFIMSLAAVHRCISRADHHYRCSPRLIGER